MRSGVSMSRPSASSDHTMAASGAALAISALIAAGPCAETRLSGSSPAGRVTKRSDFSGASSGSARSAARPAARRPALSPSKHSTGSSASFHSWAIWVSVSAVPSGATVSSSPAWASAMTSI